MNPKQTKPASMTSGELNLALLSRRAILRSIGVGCLFVSPLGSLLRTEAFAGELSSLNLLSSLGARSLSTVAKGLFELELRREALDVISALRSLGDSQRNLDKIQSTRVRTLSGTQRAGKIKSLRVELDRGVGQLEDKLESLDDNHSSFLSNVILDLDSDCALARTCLGHIKRDGTWTPRFMLPILDARARVFHLKERARTLEVKTASRTHDDGALSTVTAASTSLSSPEYPEEALSRIVTTALQGTAFSRALLGLELKASPPHQRNFYCVKTKESYFARIQEGVANGNLDQETARTARDTTTYFEKDGTIVIFEPLSEAMIASHILLLHASDQLIDEFLKREDAFPALAIGYYNWISMEFLGVRTPIGWDQSRSASRTYADDALEKTEERLLSEAGIEGNRRWLARLTQEGSAPSWKQTFQGREALIQGHDRLKCTFMYQFLQELGVSTELFSATRGRVFNDFSSLEREISTTTGMSPGELEAKFREWLICEQAGVKQRLDSELSPSRWEEHREVVRELSRLRQQAIPEAEAVLVGSGFDGTLSENCARHSKYMTRNHDIRDIRAHTELPERPGYSLEGATAAAQSNVWRTARSPRVCIEEMMSSLYHRLPLINPGLRMIGWGNDGNFSVLDCGSLCDPNPKTGVVVWPPANMKGVPLQFCPETPNPIPGEDQSQWGYPVTIQSASLIPDNFSLRLQDVSSGTPEEIECHVIGPGHSGNPKIPLTHAAGLIPKKALRKGRTYRVSSKNLPGGITSWEFCT